MTPTDLEALTTLNNGEGLTKDPSPPTSDVSHEEELEAAQLKLDAEIQEDLLGVRPSFLGRELRPLRLSSLALLQRTGNEIISGKPVEECSDLLLDSCKLVLIQSMPLRDAVNLTKNLEEFEFQAYELADTIPPENASGFIDAIIGMVSKTQEGRIEPVPDDNTSKDEHVSELMGE